jgi:threonine dehydrogenase-like Zn-dependent dehydrogenase
MRAAVVQAPGDLAITRVPDPVPRDHEVVVAVDTCGICGTDVHVLDGDYGVVRYPVIPGHEFGGVVVAVGRAVRGLSAGTRVAVDPMDYCDACSMCRSGWTNMCLNGGGLGTTAPGALAEYVAVNGARCEPLPEELGLGEASLVEPLACVLHAVDRLGPVLGRDVLILGAGPIGLLATALLDMSGGRVDLVDGKADRLDIGSRFGARRVGTSVGDLDATWDVVVDATGNPAAVADGLAVTRRAGRIALLGVAGPGRSFAFEPFDIVARELTVVGVNSVRHTFGRAARLLAAGTLPVGLLHERPLPLRATPQALERSRRAEGLKTRVQLPEAGSSGPAATLSGPAAALSGPAETAPEETGPEAAL